MRTHPCRDLGAAPGNQITHMLVPRTAGSRAHLSTFKCPQRRGTGRSIPWATVRATDSDMINYTPRSNIICVFNLFVHSFIRSFIHSFVHSHPASRAPPVRPRRVGGGPRPSHAPPTASYSAIVCLFVETVRLSSYSGCCRTHASVSGWFREAPSHTRLCHGQPCARAHFSTSRCPPPAASWHVAEFHGQSCSRAHRCTVRCPPAAASQHVCQFHGQSCARAHCSTARCPSQAARDTSPYPKGTRVSAHTSAPPGARRQRRVGTSTRPTGTRSPSPMPAARRIRESPRA